jgi:hypothetical protein
MKRIICGGTQKKMTIKIMKMERKGMTIREKTEKKITRETNKKMKRRKL